MSHACCLEAFVVASSPTYASLASELVALALVSELPQHAVDKVHCGPLIMCRLRSPVGEGVAPSIAQHPVWVLRVTMEYFLREQHFPSGTNYLAFGSYTNTAHFFGPVPFCLLINEAGERRVGYQSYQNQWSDWHGSWTWDPKREELQIFFHYHGNEGVLKQHFLWRTSSTALNRLIEMCGRDYKLRPIEVVFERILTWSDETTTWNIVGSAPNYGL